jgi:hypothetical protein
MKFVKFEGNIEELQAAYHLLTDAVENTSESAPPTTPPQLPLIPSAEIKKSNELTEEIAKVFLTRRPFPKNQIAIIKKLLSTDHEQGIKSSELAESIGCTVADVQGSMRAFGKRAAHTEGWPSGVRAFERKWLGNEMSYRLHKAVRDILEKKEVTL